MYHLATIAGDVVVAKLIAVETAIATILGLALPPCGREEALLALAPTAHTWWIAWVVDTAQIALDLAATTRDASLVNAFVLRGFGVASGCLLVEGRGGIVSAQGVLRRRLRHGERKGGLCLKVEVI